MNSNESALTIIEDEPTALYAGKPIDRDLVVEFGDTLMGVHPQATEIGVRGMRTVAQLALITGANPLPGTNGIHAWVDNNEKLCFAFGVGYWRGQAEQEGGRLWIFRPRPMDDQEREYYGVAEKQTASICAGALKRDVFSLMREAREIGIELSIKDAKQELGCVGMGIVNPGEYDAKGRTKQWKADLRAERDLLRQLVPVMQRARRNAIEGTRVNGGQDWSVGEFARLEAQTDIPDDYSADDANAELFGDSPSRAVDTDTGEIVNGIVDEPEKPEPNGNKNPTQAMLKDLHIKGANVYGKGWEEKRAEISETFGLTSSKDWTLDQYWGIMKNLDEILATEIK